MSEIRLRIKELRHERRMAMSVLEDATGLHATTLYRYERGAAWPQPDEWAKVARALGVEPYELIEGAPLLSIHREPDLQAA